MRVLSKNFRRLFVGVVMTLFGLSLNVFPLPASEKAAWGVKGSAAVVNPVVRSPLATLLSLDGEWEFAPGDPWEYRLGAGDPAWGPRPFDWSTAQKITVPGNWESQGVGEPGPHQTWDCVWDRPVWELRHVFMGMALYRKQVTIPADWTDKAIWLKIGGVRTDAYLWVNGKRAAYVNNLCATEKFNITPFVTPGETTEIIAQVRNDTPSRKGLLSAPHRFGGFYRSVELEATPTTFIDDVWARGEMEGPVAKVRVAVASTNSGTPFQGNLTMTLRDADGKKVGGGETPISGAGDYILETPVENGRLWSPEEPNLYVAEVVLVDAEGKAVHGWNERFGIRKLEVRGKRFFLNGKPYFFRGMGDHHYDPMTLVEGTDRERYVRHIRLYKEAGFNYARHHTHVPMPEYFEAADEVGLLLQPELPYYHDVTTEGFEPDPLRDIQEVHRACRRFVSFATYSCGNEGWLGSPTDEVVYRWAKENDPDRLFLHQDGGRNIAGKNADFTTGDDKAPGFCTATIKPWSVGQFDHLTVPFVAHEYLNLAIKMDPRLEDRFTGVRLSPVHVDVWRALLAQCGLDENWGAATLRAGAKLQGYYQKQGLEAARLDPECDGYSFWSMTDVSIPAGDGNAVAAQGYLNVFWEPRADGISPKEFYRFNGPTALLLSLDRTPPIFVAEDRFKAEIKISHFGAEPIPAGNFVWRMKEKDRVLADGAIPIGEIEIGTAGTIASVEISAPAVNRPTAAVMEIALEGTNIVNSYEIWVFPKRERKPLNGFVVADSLFETFAKRYDAVVRYGDAAMKPGDVLIARPDDPAVTQAETDGRSLFLISNVSSDSDVKLGWWALGTQVGTAFADSPVWGDFPHAPWMNALWFRLIRHGAFDLRNTPPLGPVTPLAVGEGRDSYYLYLGETKKGESRILISYALDLLQETPEAASLLDSLLDSFRVGAK